MLCQLDWQVRNTAVVVDLDAPIDAAPHWVLHYDYADDVVTAREPHRALHIAIVRQFKAAGKIVMGGAHADFSGAMIVFRDESSVQEFVEVDPYVLNDVVTHYRTSEWTVVN